MSSPTNSLKLHKQPISLLKFVQMIAALQTEDEHDDYDAKFEESSNFGEDAPASLDRLIRMARKELQE